MATLSELLPGAEFALKRNGIRYKLVKKVRYEYLCEPMGCKGLVSLHPKVQVKEVSYGI